MNDVQLIAYVFFGLFSFGLLSMIVYRLKLNPILDHITLKKYYTRNNKVFVKGVIES